MWWGCPYPVKLENCGNCRCYISEAYSEFFFRKRWYSQLYVILVFLYFLMMMMAVAFLLYPIFVTAHLLFHRQRRRVCCRCCWFICLCVSMCTEKNSCGRFESKFSEPIDFESMGKRSDFGHLPIRSGLDEKRKIRPSRNSHFCFNSNWSIVVKSLRMGLDAMNVWTSRQGL